LKVNHVSEEQVASIFSSACYLLHAGISCLPYSSTLQIEAEISTKI
jgi:hypothetical protein